MYCNNHLENKRRDPIHNISIAVRHLAITCSHTLTVLYEEKYKSTGVEKKKEDTIN